MNTRVLFLLFAIFLVGVSNALYFDLKQGKMKCFKDALKSQQIISGSVDVPESTNKILSFWVCLLTYMLSSCDTHAHLLMIRSKVPKSM